MSELNKKGFIHLLIPIILLLGLVAGVYLVTSGNPLKLFSRASVSKPVSPETSFTLIGPNDCPAGLVCTLQQIFLPQKGDEFSVKLYARSDIEEANLFTAKMTFPKDLVEVKEIKTEGSFVKNWVENYYDNSTGEIALSGGLPDPGYKTQPGSESSLMAVIVFKAKALGKGPVSFTDSSAIYSNLNNINILTIKRGYDISVEVKPAVTPSPAPSSSAYPERIVKLAPPAAGPFAQAAGEMRVRFLSGKYDSKTPFNISASGEVSGLAANKKYMVGLCIKGIGCVSNKTIATDGSGNAVFTDAVWNNVRNADSIDMVITGATFAVTYLSGVYTPGFVTNTPVFETGVNIATVTSYGYGDLKKNSKPEDVGVDLEEVRRMGGSLVRIFVANNLISDAETAKRLGAFLDKAAQYNIFVIPVLIDFYGGPWDRQSMVNAYTGAACPGQSTNVDLSKESVTLCSGAKIKTWSQIKQELLWVGYSSGHNPESVDKYYEKRGEYGLLNEEFFSSGYKGGFVNFVKSVVAEGRKHPNIYAWEVGNELKASPRVFIAFAKDITSLIKTLDPEHKVALGMLQSAHTGLTPAELYADLPNVDIVTVHTYDGDRSGAEDVNWARRSDKTVLIEELGFSGKGDRSGRLKDEIAFWKDAGAGGILLWGFIAKGLPDNGDGDSNFGFDAIFHTDYDQISQVLKTFSKKEFSTSVSTPSPITTKKGDGNKDGKINLIDMSILQTDWKADKDNKKKIREAMDINSDGLINSFDFSLLKKILQDSGIIKIKVK